MKANNMRKLAAAIAALCMCTAAIAPAAASAATITINGTGTVSVAKKSFAAYKILDVSADGTTSYNYSVVSEWKAVLCTYFGLDATTATDEDIVEKIEGLTTNEKLQQFANYLNNKVPAGVTAAATVTGADGATSVDISVTEPGYYMVVDTTTSSSTNAISAVMLDTTTDTISLTLKTDAPTIEKKIWEDDNANSAVDTGELVDANTAAIGDKVNYYVTSSIPDTTYFVDYYYKMTDTFAKGLTFDADSLKITAIDPDTDLVANTDYKVNTTTNADGTTTLEIIFLNMKALGDVDTNVGKDIIVQYAATVNEDAVVGESGNENEIKLTYSNNPAKSNQDTDKDGIPDSKDDDDDGDGTPDSEETDDDNDGTSDTDEDTDGDGTPDSTDDDDDGDGILDDQEVNETTDTTPDVVITYLAEFTIKKTDDKGQSLAGIGFTLYSDAACENPIFLEEGTTGTGAAGKYIVTTAEPDATEEDAEIFTPTDGTIEIYGLEAGTYYIKETTGKDGYNKINDVITMELTAKKGDTKIHDASIVHTKNDTCTWTYASDVAGTKGDTNVITVINKSGSLLPGTGGTGTALFTFGGLTLMAAAGGLYILKRRAANN